MQLSKIFVPILLLGLVCSCAFTRHRTLEPIEPSSVAAINIGDPASRVTDLLGAPTEVVQLGNRSAYRYDFTETKSAGLFLLLVGFFNSDSHQDRVWVFLNTNEEVTHIGASLDASKAEYAMPWSSTD